MVGRAAPRAMQVMFVLYAGIGLASGLIYRRIDDPRPAHDGARIAPLGPSRGSSTGLRRCSASTPSPAA